MNENSGLLTPTGSSKEELRAKIRRLRQEKPLRARQEAAAAMMDVLRQRQPLLSGSSPQMAEIHVGAYLPLEDEPDIMPLLIGLVRQPHSFSLRSSPKIWFPQTTGPHRLSWFDGTHTIVTNPSYPQAQRRHAAVKPLPSIRSAISLSSYRALREKLQTEFSWLFLPALAADVQGGRLGQGGGYYDRLLTEVTPNTTTIACLYDEEVYGRLTFQERHDQPVNYALTPRRLIALHRRGS